MSSKLYSLQIIRATAMILVLFIHTDYFFTQIFNTKFLFGLFYPGGDGGVDMFFVLSGFIIYFVHSKDINKKQNAFTYFTKRFIRIYPVYWIVTLLILHLHFLLPQYGSGNETNFLTIIRSLLLAPSTQAPIIHAAWTLVYEVIFYISFGFLIYSGFKKLKHFIYLLIILTSFGWIYSFINIQKFQESFLYIFFSYHNFEFLLGCFGAYLVLKRELRIARQLLIFGIVIFFSMVLLEFQHGEPIYPLRLIGYGLSSFFIITSLSSLEIYKRLKDLDGRFYKLLLILGNASFSIYLTHQVLISGIGRILSSKLGFLVNLQIIIFITLALTTCFGIYFYLFIEKPIIRYLRKKLT